jgi:hypothetical protein
MLRMHDHLKYPYFVAFYENRVKVGLKTLLSVNICPAEIMHARYFFTKEKQSERHVLRELIT